VASLIADPARAAILLSLIDGRAQPAGELAYAAHVTPQTASSHFSKLLAGGLLAVEMQGRHRYYRLAGPHIAFALETLGSIGSGHVARQKPRTREAERLRFARCCYDHLAGQAGVAVTDALKAQGYLSAGENKRFDITPAGVEWFDRIGLDVDSLTPSANGVARQCLDWTERRHHLAGPLGVKLMHLWCAQGWLRRSRTSRVVTITQAGWTGIRSELGVDLSRPL
jgi:DNA-binding transcriptional ArsR family regulator